MRILFDAFLVKARQAFSFPSESRARMTAVLDLVARFVHQFDASLLSAYALERRLHTGSCPLYFREAEPAFLGILVLLELLTRLSYVIWLNLTVRAEVLLTSLASDSVLAHVNGCLSRNDLARIIFDPEVNLALDELHDVAAAAGYHIGVLRQKLRLG